MGRQGLTWIKMRGRDYNCWYKGWYSGAFSCVKKGGGLQLARWESGYFIGVNWWDLSKILR